MTHLDVTCPPVEVEMKILDGSEVCELLLDVLLGRLLVDVGNQDDPSLDGFRATERTCDKARGMSVFD